MDYWDLLTGGWQNMEFATGARKITKVGPLSVQVERSMLTRSLKGSSFNP
jgi:hypothetical protein